VLVLDEPTAGVDIELRRQLWTHVKHLNALGTTILLTTHYLEEAEELCDRIAIIDRGKLVANDDKQRLLHRVDSKQLSVLVDRDLEDTPAQLRVFAPDLRDGRRLVFRYRPSRTNVGAILAGIREAGLEIVDLSTEEADLKDIFLQLVRPAADAVTDQ
jgi:ABC-2 type transport system ATP-binding protein